jgi:hypothetical protein
MQELGRNPSFATASAEWRRHFQCATLGTVIASGRCLFKRHHRGRSGHEATDALPVIAVEVRLSSKPGATPISTAKSTIDAAPQTVHSTEVGQYSTNRKHRPRRTGGCCGVGRTVRQVLLLRPLPQSRSHLFALRPRAALLLASLRHGCPSAVDERGQQTLRSNLERGLGPRRGLPQIPVSYK